MFGLISGRIISLAHFLQPFQTAPRIVLAINREVIGGMLEFSLGAVRSEMLPVRMMGQQISHQSAAFLLYVSVCTVMSHCI